MPRGESSRTIGAGSPDRTLPLVRFSLNIVGGICCGLTGPEAFVASGVGHPDSAAQPLVSFSYSSQTNSYEDSGFKPNPATNCGPSWNTGSGSGCILWEQSYANNSRFLSSTSNGQGLFQSFAWQLARDNTHGVNGGGSNNADPFYCDSHQSGYPCNEADDSGWSHVVLFSQSTTNTRLTRSGQVGAQNTAVTFNADGNWSTVQTLSVPVSLQAGSNTILFSNPNGWAPDIDRIVVNGTTYEAEASGNTLSGGAAVASCSTCSGDERVGSISNGATLQFNGINVSSAGSYAVTLYYLNGDAAQSLRLSPSGSDACSFTMTIP